MADDTTVNNANGITVDGNTANTATILITNRVQDTGSTSGAVTDNLQLVDFTSFTDGCYTFTVQVSAFDSTTPSAGSYILNGGVMSISGTPTIIDNNFTKIVVESAVITDADANAFISGNILYIQVTGVGGLNINWGVVGTYSRSV